MNKPTIVITSAVAWTGITARPQHFAKELAIRGWNVLFVDGPVTLISPIKNPTLKPRVFPARPKYNVPLPKHAKGRLTVLSPIASLPFGNMYRSLNAFNQRMLAYQIRKTAPGPYILLSMLPSSVDLLSHLHPLAVLYDCVDFHSEFSGFLNKSVVNQMEEDLTHVSRTVFTTAVGLYDRLKSDHADVRLIQNAAEVDHFAAARQVEVHPQIAAIPGPRVGFVGGIGSWIDLSLIRGLAESRPNAQVIMIGPVETDVTALRRLPNVYFLGARPYGELPQFLAGFDVTLVPFRVDDTVAQNVNPVKAYEYLAAGREVIATPIPEMVKLSELVWLTDDGAEAVAAFDRIVAGETRATEEKRRAFVKANSWSARVDEIESCIKAVIPGALSNAT